MELAKTSLQASRLFDVAANNTSPRYKECLFHMRAKRAGRNGPFFNYLSPEKIQEMAAKAYWEPYTLSHSLVSALTGLPCCTTSSPETPSRLRKSKGTRSAHGVAVTAQVARVAGT
jgi:hypothetical protein